MEDKVTEIFFYVDEFCNEWYKAIAGHQLTEDSSKNTRNKPCKMSDSEVIKSSFSMDTGPRNCILRH